MVKQKAFKSLKSSIKWSCFLVLVAYILTGLGITVGAHRYFTHKTFKANAKLQILMIILQTFALQHSVYKWAYHHRVHHKYSDTNADPHNSRRGLFFSHVGWLLVEPHPDFIKFSKTIDTSDLKADQFVMFQYRYYVPLATVTVIISTMIPYLCWDESLRASFIFGFLTRFVLTINATWLVNSAAHYFGSKPYDINISSAENKIVSFFSVGEGFIVFLTFKALNLCFLLSGFHNYHVRFIKKIIFVQIILATF